MIPSGDKNFFISLGDICLDSVLKFTCKYIRGLLLIMKAFRIKEKHSESKKKRQQYSMVFVKVLNFLHSIFKYIHSGHQVRCV